MTDFNFAINSASGEIKNFSQNFVIAYEQGSVIPSRSLSTAWNIVPFVELEDDVPVNRGAALIEEALNATQVPEPEPAPEVPEPAPEVPEPAPEVPEPAPEEEVPNTTDN